MRAQPNIPSRTSAGARYRSWNFHAFGIPSFGRRVWGAGFGAALLAPAGQGARRPPGGERVGFAVLSPPRTILSQALCFARRRGSHTVLLARIPRGGRTLRLLRPLPCPPARDAAGVRGRRCLPCGQRRCRVARRIMACRGKSRVSVRFTHQETFPARRGTGKRASPRKGRSFSRTPSAPRSPNEPFPTRNGDTPHLTDETRPLLLQNLPRLSIRSKRGPLQVASSSPPHFAANIQRAPKPSFPSPCKIPAFHPSRRRLIPPPSRRENGGLCPRPLKGSA